MRALFTRGYFTVGRVAGVPVRVHWSLPLGMVFMVGLHPLAWAAYLALLLGHELGHVWAVRGLGARVEAVGLGALGGYCRWWGTVGLSGLGLIAWSGVGVQATLLLVWLGLRVAFGWPEGAGWAAVHGVLVPLNLLLIAVNLLPLPGLDGADAWAWVRESRRRDHGTAEVRRPPPRRPRPAPERDPEAERQEAARQAEVERVFQKMLQELLPPSRVDRRDEDRED